VRRKFCDLNWQHRVSARGLADFRGTLVARKFVLVHGGWCGAWVWRDVLSGLRKLGYHASAPTLTGLGERQPCGVATADLATHIEDVVSHIWMEDLSDVTLVGWNYAGAVTTGTLDRLPDRIRSMIYLDAFMPTNGKAVIDYNQHAKIQVEGAMERDEPIPPPPLKYFGVTDPKLIFRGSCTVLRALPGRRRATTKIAWSGTTPASTVCALNQVATIVARECAIYRSQWKNCSQT
jgi:pimeloyl-ACP methyl ester carboxylesterase